MVEERDQGMKAKFNILIALLLLLAFAACDSSSDDDSSTDDDAADDDSDGQPYEGCEENTAPEFISITIIVNGLPVEQPVTLDTNDTLAFSLEYFDAECNFQMEDRRGSIGFLASDADAYAHGDAAEVLNNYYHLDGIGCSSEEDGPFVINVDPNDFAVPEDFNRLEPLWAYLVDGCLANISDPLYIDFTVHPAK